jgi:hypothetical protein
MKGAEKGKHQAPSPAPNMVQGKHQSCQGGIVIWLLEFNLL